MSAATLARVAIPLILGIVLGAKIRDELEPVTEEVDEPTLTERELATKLYQKGLHILTDDSVPEDGTDLAGYLATQYRGLYCLGRAGGRLRGQALDSVAVRLGHLHTMHKPRRDKDVIAWYATVGVSAEHSLADLLNEHPLTKQFDTRYIAHAMGEDVPNLTFDGLLQEAADHFRDIA